jgi:ubiquinone/menaquinone biosynthesis C-methylase UbiE
MATQVQISGTPAEIYEQHMVPAIFARWAPDLVETVGVRTGERALDVACGTGAATRLLVQR